MTQGTKLLFEGEDVINALDAILQELTIQELTSNILLNEMVKKLKGSKINTDLLEQEGDNNEKMKQLLIAVLSRKCTTDEGAGNKDYVSCLRMIAQSSQTNGTSKDNKAGLGGGVNSDETAIPLIPAELAEPFKFVGSIHDVVGVGEYLAHLHAGYGEMKRDRTASRLVDPTPETRIRLDELANKLRIGGSLKDEEAAEYLRLKGFTAGHVALIKNDPLIRSDLNGAQLETTLGGLSFCVRIGNPPGSYSSYKGLSIKLKSTHSPEIEGYLPANETHRRASDNKPIEYGASYERAALPIPFGLTKPQIDKLQLNSSIVWHRKIDADKNPYAEFRLENRDYRIAPRYTPTARGNVAWLEVKVPNVGDPELWVPMQVMGDNHGNPIQPDIDTWVNGSPARYNNPKSMLKKIYDDPVTKYFLIQYLIRKEILKVGIIPKLIIDSVLPPEGDFIIPPSNHEGNTLACSLENLLKNKDAPGGPHALANNAELHKLIRQCKEGPVNKEPYTKLIKICDQILKEPLADFVDTADDYTLSNLYNSFIDSLNHDNREFSKRDEEKEQHKQQFIRAAMSLYVIDYGDAMSPVPADAKDHSNEASGDSSGGDLAEEVMAVIEDVVDIVKEYSECKHHEERVSGAKKIMREYHPQMLLEGFEDVSHDGHNVRPVEMKTLMQGVIKNMVDMEHRGRKFAAGICGPIRHGAENANPKPGEFEIISFSWKGSDGKRKFVITEGEKACLKLFLSSENDFLQNVTFEINTDWIANRKIILGTFSETHLKILQDSIFDEVSVEEYKKSLRERVEEDIEDKFLLDLLGHNLINTLADKVRRLKGSELKTEEFTCKEEVILQKMIDYQKGKLEKDKVAIDIPGETDKARMQTLATITRLIYDPQTRLIYDPHEAVTISRGVDKLTCELTREQIEKIIEKLQKSEEKPFCNEPLLTYLEILVKGLTLPNPGPCPLPPPPGPCELTREQIEKIIKKLQKEKSEEIIKKVQKEKSEEKSEEKPFCNEPLLTYLGTLRDGLPSNPGHSPSAPGEHGTDELTREQIEKIIETLIKQETGKKALIAEAQKKGYLLPEDFLNHLPDHIMVDSNQKKSIMVQLEKVGIKELEVPPAEGDMLLGDSASQAVTDIAAKESSCNKLLLDYLEMLLKGLPFSGFNNLGWCLVIMKKVKHSAALSIEEKIAFKTTKNRYKTVDLFVDALTAMEAHLNLEPEGIIGTDRPGPPADLPRLLKLKWIDLILDQTQNSALANAQERLPLSNCTGEGGVGRSASGLFYAARSASPTSPAADSPTTRRIEATAAAETETSPAAPG